MTGDLKVVVSPFLVLRKVKLENLPWFIFFNMVSEHIVHAFIKVRMFGIMLDFIHVEVIKIWDNEIEKFFLVQLQIDDGWNPDWNRPFDDHVKGVAIVSKLEDSLAFVKSFQFHAFVTSLLHEVIFFTNL